MQWLRKPTNLWEITQNGYAMIIGLVGSVLILKVNDDEVIQVY